MRAKSKQGLFGKGKQVSLISTGFPQPMYAKMGKPVNTIRFVTTTPARKANTVVIEMKQPEKGNIKLKAKNWLPAFLCQ